MAGSTYSGIYNYDIDLYGCIKKKYKDDSIAWHLFAKSYIDPDGYPTENDEYRVVNGVKCTADGLLSIRRIHEKEGFDKEFIETFKRFREHPIFFFPCEWGGINQARATLLEDRIDHALFDLKNYCETKGEKCILINAYKRPITQKWLENRTFKDIVNELNIVGIFVNDKYEVYDLEKDGNRIVKSLKESYCGIRSAQYLKCWSDRYYENVKDNISKYYDKHIR